MLQIPLQAKPTRFMQTHCISRELGKGHLMRTIQETGNFTFSVANQCLCFMSSYENQYVGADDGFKVLMLSYRRGRGDTNRKFSMYFYLPDKNDGLDDLVEKMASTPGFVDSHIPGYRSELAEFRIPKFKIEFGFSVTGVLDRLGLRSISLYHKACVEIDEAGAEAAAEAAAASVVEEDGCSLYWEPPKRKDFVADHPFLFLIREDKTGTVLFVGQIIDPSKSSSA